MTLIIIIFGFFLNKLTYTFITENLELQKNNKAKGKSLVTLPPKDNYY